MGGNAFSDLWTPRMPTSVYHHVRSKLHTQLCSLFQTVETPINGPGKTDFGDIDIFVASPQEPTLSITALFKLIERTLQPVATNIVLPNRSINLAIPWPDAFPAPEKPPATAPGTASVLELTSATTSTPGHAEASVFIQVDIHIYESPESWKWAVFRHSHGDFWNMVKYMVRPFGLAAGDKALYLRITEIEKISQKRSRIFLSDEPDAVLDFLGLERKGSFWEGPAESEEALFEYVATSPLFYVSPQPSPLNDSDYPSSAERRKTQKRPCFNRWINEFIPRCREQGRFSVPRMTKEKLQEQLYGRLGDDLRKEYTTTRDNVLEQNAAHNWAKKIREFFKEQNLPSSMIYGSLVKAFRNILLHNDPTFECAGAVLPTELKSPKWEWDEDMVRAFLQRHQDGVLREIQRVQALKKVAALGKAEALKRATEQKTQAEARAGKSAGGSSREEIK
ncbi:hypothetical protein CFIMG_008325RA00001 [Ceratocystis fimbriata CBS 114723]|uniref:Uncharacterized protein n=1 Tax=Ceratocystis fimbriata CBS 114723 TaxID=1035309 RepID=A0A2C5X4J2_9PEZI|nr:hypothetical protein CFIMG_008325RA00001 [Ceratocystis fimbriata CBS 114723]